jgi:hypothetical protein
VVRAAQGRRRRRELRAVVQRQGVWRLRAPLRSTTSPPAERAASTRCAPAPPSERPRSLTPTTAPTRPRSVACTATHPTTRLG